MNRKKGTVDSKQQTADSKNNPQITPITIQDCSESSNGSLACISAMPSDVRWRLCPTGNAADYFWGCAPRSGIALIIFQLFRKVEDLPQIRRQSRKRNSVAILASSLLTRIECAGKQTVNSEQRTVKKLRAFSVQQSSSLRIQS